MGKRRMERLLQNTSRWTASATVALVVSAMYATGFFYTHPVIILAGFIVCAAAMFAPTLSKLFPRRNLWFWAYSIGLSLGLTYAIPATHFIWNGALNNDWFLTDLTSIDSIKVSAPVIALLFAGIVGTTVFAPSGAPT